MQAMCVYTREQYQHMGPGSNMLCRAGFLTWRMTYGLNSAYGFQPILSLIGVYIISVTAPLFSPRGNTLKNIEKECNAKIMIRGKGSVKEGKVGRKDGQMLPGEDEPLHALVTANTMENVKKAVEQVRGPKGAALQKGRRWCTYADNDYCWCLLDQKHSKAGD